MGPRLNLAKRKKRLQFRKENKRIALERITILFTMAKEVFKKDPELAQHYSDLARRIGMRYKVKIPRKFRKLICKHCKSFILPGINCTIRIQQRREPHVVITCLICGGRMRIPLRNRGIPRR